MALTNWDIGGCCCPGDTVDCMPCNIPTHDLTLSWELPGGLGGDPGSPCVGSIPLTYNAGPVTWTGTFPDGVCGPCTAGSISVQCGVGIEVVWLIGGANVCEVNLIALEAGSTCDPFDITITIPPDKDCGLGCGVAGFVLTLTG